MAAKKRRPNPKKMSISKAVYVLYDRNGKLADIYETIEDARADAWGPRFREYQIYEYTRGRIIDKREKG
jgi:3'-phosphoadenosine 5'-phosphosulfate sulfotransferase